jgi:hypothetical protein
MKAIAIIMMCCVLCSCATMGQQTWQPVPQEEEVKITTLDVVLSILTVAFWVWLGSNQGWW